jgi:hypothetical protein
VDGFSGAKPDANYDEAREHAGVGLADDPAQDDDAKAGECDKGGPELLPGIFGEGWSIKPAFFPWASLCFLTSKQYIRIRATKLARP